MGRLIGEIPEPDPNAEVKPPDWYHEPSDPERVAWLEEQRSKGQARVAELRAQLHAELTREQWQAMFGLVLQVQYLAQVDRILMCMVGYSCDRSDIGLSAFTL
jgi:hypothetical protein